ncbi:efflux RND transporter periplasmic adaptor subunit [Paraglaciecola psychrophila]|uniref:RND family efflux transporter MFP subunit n=1 Tax=Paraglaciecola psychrophila 170 TaxID=1129794 RepID=K7A5Y1_9ALTE|nr:efflux RND transporter periplasmic adaptor subunit [Paraglaciecola psychrophila]AGH44880.1 RND family efflux transporter MFP subunit [Paraglaciecola psychrophila 170]GAC36238.1 HlyD family secretion protein [Paraglaciecola psychrophila 170]
MKITDTSAQDAVIIPKKSVSTYVFGGVLFLTLILILVLLYPYFFRWSESSMTVSADRIRIGTVKRGDFVRDISIQGRVVAAISPKLYSPAQGTITFIVDAGDSVLKGQILATIDSPELSNQLKQEQSTLQRMQFELARQKIQSKKQVLENQKSSDLASVALTAADREKRRADQAYQSHSISQIDFEKAQDDLENAKLVYKHSVKDAKLNIESLEFEVQTKQLQVDRQALEVNELSRQETDLTLLSPVNGIVGNLAVEQKNQVGKNQGIMSVVDLTEFELDVDIPESYADDLAIGMVAEVNLNGQTHQATLVTISPEIENNQVTGRVRFAKTDSNNNQLSSPLGLRQNQRLTTRILMESKRDVLIVERGQFLQSANGNVAYVLQDGLATRTTINTGARSLSVVEVLNGLTEGQQIIISSTDQFSAAKTVLISQ